MNGWDLPLLLAQHGDDDAAGAIAGLFGGVFLLVWLAIIVVVIAGMWKVFEKAGQPGWAAIVPIYNAYVLCVIAGKPGWWVILMLIPCVSIIVEVIVLIELAKKFGQGVGFAIGMFLLPFVFIPILGFGDSRYNANAS